MNCAADSVAATPSVPLLKLPSLALIAVPKPLAPTPSMKYSAATTLLSASFSFAVTVGGEFVVDELTAVPDVTGPVVSYVTELSVGVEGVLPLPTQSVATFAAIEAVTVPSEVIPETATL